MQNNLIDIGANLTHSSFDSDRKAIIEESFKQGIKNIIITGSNYLDSYEAHLLATQYPTKLYSTAGIHPHYAKEFNYESIKLLKNLLTHANVKAVGDCGLDYYRNYSSKNKIIYLLWIQSKWLRLQEVISSKVFIMVQPY